MPFTNLSKSSRNRSIWALPGAVASGKYRSYTYSGCAAFAGNGCAADDVDGVAGCIGNPFPAVDEWLSFFSMSTTVSGADSELLSPAEAVDASADDVEAGADVAAPVLVAMAATAAAAVTSSSCSCCVRKQLTILKRSSWAC